MTSAPWTFDQARAAARDASTQQRMAEDFVRQSAKDAAQKECAYRMALANKIAILHAEGAAWTVCQDMARGDKDVARLRMERDIAEGVREAALQASWRRVADRKDTRDLLNWSMRREFAENGGWMDREAPV